MLEWGNARKSERLSRMVRSEAAASEYFQIRKLLWDELKLNVCASEEGELRSAIGSHLIEGNEVRIADSLSLSLLR